MYSYIQLYKVNALRAVCLMFYISGLSACLVCCRVRLAILNMKIKSDL